MNRQGMPPSEPISRQIDQVMNSRIENQPNPLEALIHLPAACWERGDSQSAKLCRQESPNSVTGVYPRRMNDARQEPAGSANWKYPKPTVKKR